MGQLVDGKWADQWYDTKASKGRFVRAESPFRSWVTTDSSTPLAPQAGRYHLYVSLACPWAHRTLIVRQIKKLEHAIAVSVVEPLWGEGWAFAGGTEEHIAGATSDPINGATALHQIYTAAQADFSGRVTVPVLWDTQTKTIVNNESSEIIRMFNAGFGDLADGTVDLRPDDLAAQIDAINDYIYPRINNGVYRTGFASTQEAYEEAFTELFAALDTIEARLADQRYLVGDRLTEADVRLYTTLVRFDPVYVGHFKCNKKRIADYPNLWGYTRDLYQTAGFGETTDMVHIKRHYYGSHPQINPTGVVPMGPEIDFSAPHDRAKL